LYEAKKTGKAKIVHPEIDVLDPKAVTRAGKEILYPISRPATKKKQLRQEDQEKELRQTRI